jgi:hypothetical protein
VFLQRLDRAADFGAGQVERFGYFGEAVRFDHTRKYLHRFETVHGVPYE